MLKKHIFENCNVLTQLNAISIHNLFLLGIVVALCILKGNCV